MPPRAAGRSKASAATPSAPSSKEPKAVTDGAMLHPSAGSALALEVGDALPPSASDAKASRKAASNESTLGLAATNAQDALGTHPTPDKPARSTKSKAKARTKSSKVTQTGGEASEHLVDSFPGTRTTKPKAGKAKTGSRAAAGTNRRPVLGAVSAPNEVTSAEMEPAGPKRQGRPPKSASKKSKAPLAVSRHAQSLDQDENLSVDSDSSEVEPPRIAVKRSAEGVSMPEEQIATYLDGFDLEASNRISRIRSHLAVTLDSARSQMTILLTRLPVAARNLPLQEFIDLYSAEVKTMVQRVGRRASGEEDDWEELKKKRAREQEAAAEDLAAKSSNKSVKRSKGKAATLATPKASASAVRTMSSRSRAASSRTVAKTNASSSMAGTKPPSAQTFSPSINLPSRAVSLAASQTKTPSRPSAVQAKAGRPSRLAKIGEMVQMLSLNGSPITGIIGPDGRFRHLTEHGDSDEEEPADAARDSISSMQATASHAATAAVMRQISAAGPSTLNLPSSPAPINRSGLAFSSSSIAFDDDLRPREGKLGSTPFAGSSEPPQKIDDDELPDEEAEMRRFMEEEQARRRASKLLSTKTSAPKLRQAYTLGSSSPAGRGSSQPPSSSPLRGGGGGGSSMMAPSSMRSASRLGSNISSSLRSSSPNKSGGRGNTAQQQQRPATAVGTMKQGSSSASGHQPSSGRLSFVNARGETIDLASVKDEDLPQDQKMNLFGLFSRWKRDVASPKKRT
ncbi:unnamed protein product [Parajaminaea phylloscopi]